MFWIGLVRVCLSSSSAQGSSRKWNQARRGTTEFCPRRSVPDPEGQEKELALLLLGGFPEVREGLRCVRVCVIGSFAILCVCVIFGCVLRVLLLCSVVAATYCCCCYLRLLLFIEVVRIREGE